MAFGNPEILSTVRPLEYIARFMAEAGKAAGAKPEAAKVAKKPRLDPLCKLIRMM